MSRFQYLLLMAACLLVTFPLEFVFRARVYRRPGRLLAALLPTVAVFLVWDAIKLALAAAAFPAAWWFVGRRPGDR